MVETEPEVERDEGVTRLRKQVQLSLDPETWEDFQEVARDNNRPYSREVDIALREHIQNQRKATKR
jgi:hypothetical protein